MKTSILALAISGALLSPVLGADIFNGSTKDGPSVAGTTVNWSGVYVGGRLGYGHANHDLTVESYRNAVPDTPCPEPAPADTDKAAAVLTPICGEGSGTPGASVELFGLNGLDSSGVTGGGQLGVDMQRGRFVFGAFGSYDMSGAETTVSVAGTELKAIEKGDEWSLGVRAGLLVNPRTLAYVLAAYTESEFTYAGIGEMGAAKDVTHSGLTVGGGVEFAVTNNIFLGVEGTHTFYDKETLADSCGQTEDCGEPGAGGTRLNDEIGETKVMGTLKVKLNSGPAAILD